VQDADLNRMRRAIADFSTLLTNAGPQAVGLFYYAGHGLQINGENYLIPLNANIQKAADAELEAVPASLIVKQMEFVNNPLNIIILDACRNNPLSRGMRSAGGGLARMDAPMGTFIAYSTAPGETAADGTGRNSPYTMALTKAMVKPGIAIEEAFRDARVDVLAATQRQQIPWESSSLTGAFVFNPGPAGATQVAAVAAPAPAASPTQPTAPTAPATRTPEPAKPAGKVKACQNCPEMVAIPAGTFMMGSPSGEDGRQDNEGPQTKISIRAFSMGKYPVTRGQFDEFVKATGYKPARRCFADMRGNGKFAVTSDANYTNTGFHQTDQDPVVCVSWDDAKAYVQWLAEGSGKAYRLPSESEWEYAARAGATGSRYWGDSADDACDYADAADRSARNKYPNWKVVDCDDGYSYTAPVGKFKPNKFGLYDVLGNVKQWVADCATETISEIPTDGSSGGDQCEVHSLRGSSWESLPDVMRLADRQTGHAGEAGIHIGFRVALSQ
jgi:formylglycine-generating enzyme required for sulfatase activity